MSRCTSYDFCSLTQESRQVHQSLLSCVYFCYVQLSKLLRSTFEENWGQFESSTLTSLNAKFNFIFSNFVIFEIFFPFLYVIAFCRFKILNLFRFNFKAFSIDVLNNRRVVDWVACFLSLETVNLKTSLWWSLWLLSLSQQQNFWRVLLNFDLYYMNISKCNYF